MRVKRKLLHFKQYSKKLEKSYRDSISLLQTYWSKYSSYLPSLTEDQKQKLDLFFKSICEEAAPRGFVGKSDQETLWLRHILDSLLVFGQKNKQTNQTINWGDRIIDLGSGAGLPGVVLGIMMKNTKITLLDSSRKKVAFLLNIKQTMRLKNLEVVAANADKDFSQKNDTVVFRAFQKPIVSLELSLNHLKPKGQIIYWRSKSFMYEQNIEINKKILERLQQLGITIVNYISFNTPEKLGNRGVYILFRNTKVSDHFPRSLHDILVDPLNKML